MVRRVGFDEEGDAAKPVTYQATAAQEKPKAGPGLVIVAIVVLFLIGMGLAILLTSLSRGSLPGIVFGMMFTVTTASMGVSHIIKRFRAEREAARNTDWRRNTQDRP